MQLAQELLTNIQCNGDSRSFAKETRAWKMKSTVAGHWKRTTIVESHYWSWSSYNYTRSCQRTQRQPFYDHSAFETNWKGEKADRKILKIIILKCPLLLFYATIMNHFSIRLWQAMKSGFCKTTSDDQLSDWMEKKLQSTSQSQTFTKKKKSWSLFGGLLPVWSTTAFWILAKSLHLKSMLSKLMRCTQNSNAGSQHWSTERAQFFSMITPKCTSHNQCFKSWMNWTMKFCLICHSYLTTRQLTIMSSGILTTFCGKMLPQPAGGGKCFLRVRGIPKHGFLCYKNKQTHLSLAKMCWL